MQNLVITTLIWAFSFSLIGHFIVGKMDIYIAIFIRFILAALTLLPSFDLSLLKKPVALKVLLIGAIQIGLMYIFYFKSFQYLSVAEVALFTILTPMYVTLSGDFFKRKFSPKSFLAVIISIIGAAIIKWGKIDEVFIQGLICIQLSSLCFSSGQVLYKAHVGKGVKSFSHRSIFCLFYIGALIPIVPLMLLKSDFTALPSTPTQYIVLLWLGIVASGVGYYLWNSGAKKVSYGTLAVMNNAVIPCAILVNVIFWEAKIQWPSFLVGGLFLCVAVYLTRPSSKLI